MDLDLGLLKIFDDLGMENMGVQPLFCKLSIDSVVVKELCWVSVFMHYVWVDEICTKVDGSCCAHFY